VAAVSSLAHEFEMDTEKQRQRRHSNMRLAESRYTRSEQLFVMPTESLTKLEWLPGPLEWIGNIKGPAGF